MNKRMPTQRDMDRLWFDGLKHAEAAHNGEVSIYDSKIEVPYSAFNRIGHYSVDDAIDSYNKGIEDYRNYMVINHGNV